MGASFQGSFTGGELDPALSARVDISKYGVGCKKLENFIVQPHGGVYRRPGLGFLIEALGATRLIPFQYNVEQAYVLVFSDLEMMVLKDGGVVLDSNISTSITAATQASPCQITATAHGLATGDRVYISGVVEMTELNNRFFTVTVVNVNTVTLDGIDSTGYTLFVTSGGTLAKVYTVTTPYPTASLDGIYVAQSADTMYLCHAGYATRTLTRTDHDLWTFSTLTLAAGISAPTGLSATWTTGAGTPPARTALTLLYRVAAVNSAGEESLRSSSTPVSGFSSEEWINGDYVTVAFSSVADAVEYNVYKNVNGIYGYIGTTTTTSFRDDNFGPDLTYVPVSANNDPFSGSGNYPTVVAFFKQRLWLAGTTNYPTTMWASQVNLFSNFNEAHPIRDSDGLEFALASTQINDIRWMLPFGDLLVGTSGAEWQVFSTTEGAITPSTTSAKIQSHWGSSAIKPIIIGDSVVHIQNQRSKLRDLFYSLEKDSYTGNDLTVMVNHLFSGKSVVSWAYQRSPDSILWCVMSDGTLLGLTYHKEHQIWGWHRHESDGGLFESVASIPGATYDDVYVVVNRGTINGVANRRYIEKLDNKWILNDGVAAANYLDSSLSYSGSSATVFRGLDHLEGETVDALVDGSPVTGLTVSDGTVTLDTAGTDVHVGINFTSTLAPMGVEQFGAEAGSIGRVKSLSKIIVRFLATVGGKIGPLETYVDPLKFTPDVYGEAVVPEKLLDYEFVPPANYSRDGSFYIIQDQPLPMTVLAIMPDFSLGGM